MRFYFICCISYGHFWIEQRLILLICRKLNHPVSRGHQRNAILEVCLFHVRRGQRWDMFLNWIQKVNFTGHSVAITHNDGVITGNYLLDCPDVFPSKLEFPRRRSKSVAKGDNSRDRRRGAICGCAEITQIMAICLPASPRDRTMLTLLLHLM